MKVFLLITIILLTNACHHGHKKRFLEFRQKAKNQEVYYVGSKGSGHFFTVDNKEYCFREKQLSIEKESQFKYSLASKDHIRLGQSVFKDSFNSKYNQLKKSSEKNEMIISYKASIPENK